MRGFMAWMIAGLLTASCLGAEDIWALGKPDAGFGEFAQSDGYANYAQTFTEPVEISIGQADAEQQWPWIHPGPQDNWAGDRSRIFTIVFDLPAGADCPAYELSLGTVAAHYGSPPVLQVDLNGFTREIATRPGCRNDDVLEKPAEGTPAVYNLLFHASALKPKDNRLTITNTNGSWILYDYLQLVGKSAVIEKIGLTPTRGALRLEGDKPGRLVKIDYQGGLLTGEAELTAKYDGREIVKKLTPETDLVGTELLLPVDQVDRPIEVALTLKTGDQTIDSSVTLPPVRKWEVYLVHQTHLDIGYTDRQEEILALQVQSLKDAIKYIEETKNYPEEAKFRFHPEGMWAVDEFMRTATEEEKAALIEAARRRQIHIDAMYAQAMTGMYNDEELLELMDSAVRFGKQYGVTVDSAMQTDVPGYTWGLVPALAKNGIKYMTMGPNPGHRVGRLYYWGDKPFWWESPSGKDRILCWLSSYHYALWHGKPLGYRLPESQIFDLIDQFAKKDFPYDIIMLRNCYERDNGRPNRVVSDDVKEWNEKYLWPRLILARNSQVMEELERRYGDQIPVVRGDITPYWEDGCESTSYATGINRIGCERIIQAEVLWALLQPKGYPEADFVKTWTDLIMYDEHTWGAHCSISLPDDPFTVSQDEYKQAYAKRGYTGAEQLLQGAWAGRRQDDGGCVDVFNSNSWSLTQITAVPAEASQQGDQVLGADGKPVASQRLSDGRLAFRAEEVPPFAAKRYRIAVGDAPGEGSAYVDADKWTLGNDLVTVVIDPASGAISSLKRKGIDAELVNPGDDGNRGLDDYLYIIGRDATQNRQRYDGGVKLRVIDPGPLVVTVAVESEAPDCNKLIRQITLCDGSDDVRILNRMDKIMERRPEGTFFGFPFNVPDGQWHIDLPWSVIRPEVDQLPGANRNYYCVQRWCNLSNDRYGVTWVPLESNMMQFSPILYTPPWGVEAWREQIEPGGTLYAWVCNNHWETNYKAGQDGILEFNFVVRPYVGTYDQAEVQRFARSVHQPLLPLPVAPDAPPVESLLSLDNNAVVVTCLKPTRDGKGFLLRLFNTTDVDQTVSIQWKDAPKGVWISDTLETVGEKAPESLSLKKYEIVTLRFE